MRRFAALLAAAMLIGGAVPALAKEESRKTQKAQEKRGKIDRTARETLDHLFRDSTSAKQLFDQAYGYAVFDNTKVSFGLTGGGGSGVAIEKGSGKRTYMRMGSGGVGLGLGAQVYQVVFLFQNRETMNKFVETGWQAEGSANAVAGKAGANAEATFTNGIALYQITGAGLMLQADIAGTKYWKADKLN